MPWYFPWSDSLKKRACRYLLQHYLGHFLKEKLTLDQLSVDLYNGTGEINDLSLDVQSLNEALASYNVPVEIVDGFVGGIVVSVPWSALLTENTHVEIRNLEVTLQPRQRDDTTGCNLESMLSNSMTSSMQLAEQCIRQEEQQQQQEEPAEAFEGLEMFAQTIETVLSHIHVTFVDTIVRMEHVGRDANTGSGLELHMARIMYSDQASAEQQIHTAAFAIKNLSIMGLSIFCDEFPAQKRTFTRSTLDPFPQYPAAKESQPIQVAAMSGKQEIKLKLKQEQHLPGPKLDIECSFGSLNVHLSPRQLHLILELLQGLASPDLCDNSNMKPSSKPMEDADFAKVEQDLQNQLSTNHPRAMQPILGESHYLQATSTIQPCIDDDAIEEVYFSLDDHNTVSLESSITSSTNTSHSGSTITNYRKQSNKQKDAALHKLLDEPAGELTRVHGRLSFLAVMILHEDPPSLQTDILDSDESSATTSTDKLQEMATKYFGRVHGISIAGQHDMASLREDYTQACPFDHIGLLCRPLTLETRQGMNTSVELTIGNAELVEAVFDRCGVTKSLKGFHLPIENIMPEYCELLTFMTDDEDPGGASAMFRSTLPPHPCFRLKYTSAKVAPRRHSVSQISSLSIELASCFTEVDITIVDRIHELLNPQPRTNNYSKTQMNVMDSSVEEDDADENRMDLKLTSSSLTLCLRFPIPDLREGVAKQPWWRRCLREESVILELQDVTMQHKAHIEPTEFDITCRQISVLFQEKRNGSTFHFGHIGAATNFDEEDGDEFGWPRMVLKIYPEASLMMEEDDTEEMPDSLNGACQFPKPTTSPFSSRKVIYDNNEMVMPGDRSEMLDFQEKAAANSKTVLEINLPKVTVDLKSKDFMELIYNRFINDLILWQPEAPTPHSANIIDINPGFPHQFSLCKSAVHQESSSSEDEDDEFSIKPHKYKQQTRQSYMAVALNIGNGDLLLRTKLKDEPSEMRMKLGDASLLVVSRFQGDADLSYLAIRSHSAYLIEDGEPLLYLSEPGVITSLQGQVGLGGETEDQLSLAMRIQMDTLQNIKDYTVALGLRGTTLRHRSTSTSTWLDKLLDFFDLKDYPIAGYSLPHILTELHVHMWCCAIDYRPLYLPHRALVTFETFSICSNLLAEANMSLLTFTVDDAALYLALQRHPDEAINMQRDYVCVIDVGLFELSLRTTNGLDPRYPKLQLRASNNIVHVRTCSDTLQALSALINYLATDGDLNKPLSRTTLSNATDSVASDMSQSVCSDSKLEDNVPDLMADAMVESVGQARATRGGKIYFEPDDIAYREEEEDDIPFSDDDIVDDIDDDFDDEEEFCIINDPGMGISPRDGEPIIRILTDDAIVIKDNHFSMPLGTTDLLSAPDHFPVPTHRYTLAELSIVWYMYGGKDFSPVPPSSLSSKAMHQHKSGGKLGWQARGGPGRDLDVLMELQLNKVRLQYEQYPENTVQSSRQVLLIKEIEIRDRLASSKINKFLYLYASDKVPRQSHANMLLIKALHLRTDSGPVSEECLLRVSLQPLRLHVDQDALFFLKTFFAEIGSKESKEDEEGDEPAPVRQVGGPVEEEPPSLIMFDEMSINDEEEQQEEEQAANSQPVYFKRFIFSPDVPIRVDYHGKRVSLEHGTLAGLIVGLAHLNCSELRLKRIHHMRGLLGLGKLMTFAFNEWLHDIKTRQLPSILGGVGPMHSLVQLVQGIRDLIWLPVEQYRRDGRFVRGLQRGASSFLTCTAMSALELTNRIVQTVQSVGEVSFDLVTPGPGVKKRKREKWRRTLNQPADLREGVTNACNIFKEGFKDTAENIVRVAVAEHDQKGLTGAVGGVLRQVPPTIIQPVLIATEATSNILGGMRNQLLPERKREEEDKWKPDED